MASEEATKAHAQMVEKNGESDWHLSTAYEDSEINQAFSIRPDYAYDDAPRHGDVSLHLITYDDQGAFAEAEINVSTKSMTRICMQFLALMKADQEQFDLNAQADAEEAEEDDDDDETPDEPGDGSQDDDPEDP